MSQSSHADPPHHFLLRPLCLSAAWEDSNFLSALKFTSTATRVCSCVCVCACVCFQTCMQRGEREGKETQRGNQTRCAVKGCAGGRVCSSQVAGQRTYQSLIIFTHALSRKHTHTLCSQLRALCLSILVIICLPASLLVALGNAHLSLD